MIEMIRTVLVMSVSGSIIALLLFALKPLIKNRLPKTAQYYLWFVVLAALLVPVSKLIVLPVQTSQIPLISNTVDRYVVNAGDVMDKLYEYYGYCAAG